MNGIYGFEQLVYSFFFVVKPIKYFLDEQWTIVELRTM